MSAPKLYYALESLPELIGERQFNMIVGALGLSDAVREAKIVQGDKFDRAYFVSSQIARMWRENDDAARKAREDEFARFKSETLL